MRNCQVGHAVRHHLPAELLAQNFLGHLSAAREPHGWQVLAVGELFEAFQRPAHTDKALDFVVVRSQFPVVERPVLSVAVAAGGLEFVVAVAIAFAPPAECLPAYLPAPNPHKRLIGRRSIGILVFVNKELVAVFVAGVAQPLHGLIRQQRFLISKTAELQLVGPNVFREVTRRDARRAGFQHENGQAMLSQFFSHPAAAGAGPDDDGIVNLFHACLSG